MLLLIFSPIVDLPCSTCLTCQRIISRATLPVVSICILFLPVVLAWLVMPWCGVSVRQSVHQQWTHVLVDEFQDTSLVQFRFLAELCSHGRITVVGDDDQVGGLEGRHG